MKKTRLKLLCLALSAILLISCTNQPENSTTESTTATTKASEESTSVETTTEPIQTTETTTEATLPKPNYFISPEDEIRTTKTVTATSEDGIELTITVYGYARENREWEFYVKSNEKISFDLQVTNHADTTVYQFYSQISEFPVIYGDIENNENIELEIGNMLGYQEAIRVGQLESGKTVVKHAYFLLNEPEKVFSTIGSTSSRFQGPIYFIYDFHEINLPLDDNTKINTRSLIFHFDLPIVYAAPHS